MIAREGLREISLATLVLGAVAFAACWLYWPLSVIPFLAWLGVLAFFRDPPRRREFGPGQLCSPADGRVTEITHLDHYESIGGPATRVGVFLSLFNVHINRAPCAGRVRCLSYRAGEFLDARRPESGHRNESNSILIDPEPPMPGPVEIRQIAGLVARRIICHCKANGRVGTGERIGMIKFGSRTELIFPRLPQTQVCVRIGDSVRAGITLMAQQPVPEPSIAASSTPAAEAPMPRPLTTAGA